MLQLLLHLLFSAIITMFIVTVGFLFALALWYVLRVKADREHAFTLDNLGNCRSTYHLTVGSLEPALKFTLFYNKLPLALVPQPAESEDVEEYVPVETSQPAQASPSKVSEGADAAAKSGQVVASSAGKAASFLGELGSFLPGSAGRRLKETATKSRNVQMTTLRAVRGQQMVRRKAGALQKNKTGRPGASAQPATHSQGGFTSYVVQTPELESGQSISLALRISLKKRRYPRGSFPYTIQVQPTAVDFPEAQAEPIIKGGMVYFEPVSWWRYALPVFSSVMVALLAMVALVYSYLYIWQ